MHLFRKYLSPRLIVWTSLTIVLILSCLSFIVSAIRFHYFLSINSQPDVMSPVTAFCFLASCIVLILIRSDVNSFFKWTVATALTMVICSISLITLYHYFYLLLKGSDSSFSDVPVISYFLSDFERMALLTAGGFAILSCILFLLIKNKIKTMVFIHSLLVPIFLAGYLIIVSHILNVRAPTKIRFVSESLLTGIALCFICSAVIFMKPGSRTVKLFYSNDIAGIMTTRLLPSLLILPIIIGWLRIQGENLNIYRSEEGVVIVAVAYAFCFLLLIVFTARLVTKLDLKRKISEKTLIENEIRFRSVLENSLDVIIRVNLQTGRYDFVSPSVEKVTGFSPDELMGMEIQEDLLKIHPADLPSMNEALSQSDDTGYAKLEYRQKNKNGDYIWLSNSMSVVKDANGLPLYRINSIWDITDRKRSEEALSAAKERTTTILNGIADTFYSLDDNWRFLEVNQAAELAPFARPAAELLGNIIWDLYPNLVGTTIHQHYIKAAANKSMEHYISQSPLNSRWYEVFMQGHNKGLDVYMRDITQKKEAEDALSRSEQKLKYHLENSPLAVVEWDNDFKIIYWSDEAERIFGHKREEALGIKIDLLNIIYEDDIPLVEKTMRRLMGGKELKVVSQNRNIRKTGEIIECIWYNSVLLNDKGEINSVLSLVEDITLLRKTEKDLRESRENYKELVTNARSIILKMDTNGVVTFANEYAQSFFGYSLEELLGRSVMETIVPQQDSTGRDMKEMADEIITDPDKFSVNINENIKKNGEIVWLEWYNKALYDHQGKRTGHIGIAIDITKRKKAETALKENEKKLWSVLDATLESIYMFDRNGIICMSNSTGLERLNMKTENEILGHHYSEFMAPEVSSVRQKKLDEVFSRGIPLEFSDERDERTFHHNFFPVFKDNEVEFVVSYSSDITARTKAELKLKESEDRFRTIAESLTVMIAIVRIKDLALTFTNEPFEQRFGFNMDDLSAKKFIDTFYTNAEYSTIRDILKAGGQINNMEVQVRNSFGTSFWIMLSVRKINFMYEPSYLAVAIDISESKRTQFELIRLNRVLDAHSKSSQAMMHCTDEFKYIDEVCKIIIEDCGHSMTWVGYAQNDDNKSVIPVAHYGFEKGYIDQLNISWDDTERGRGPTGTAIRTGKISMCRNMQTDPAFIPWKESAISNGYESSIVLPLISDGKSFGAISIYSRELDPFSTAEIDLLSDLADDLAYGITFLRLSESERAAARAIRENEIKLKELIVTKDKFFNIVAHDLKNPFTSLLGSSELLYDNIEEMTTENVRNLALILNDSAKGGYAILQNLLDWSRSQTGLLKFNPEYINLKDLINENIDNFLLQITNKSITMRSELTADLMICADKNMINTILRNLLSNAIKYTYKGGTIIVSAVSKVEEVMLTVKDSGIGITKEHIDSLFRLENSLSLPGTEKEQGTGLGLKLSKEFTEMMGGKIWVVSELGHGSEFNFTIPFNSADKI